MTEEKLNKRLYKITLEALKVIPMLLALCTLLNILLDFLGKDSFVLSLLGGISVLPLTFLYLVSYVFHYCAYHRMFLHYILFNNILTYIDYYIGIPVSTRILFMLFVFTTGLFLFLVLYYYKKEHVADGKETAHRHY